LGVRYQFNKRCVPLIEPSRPEDAWYGIFVPAGAPAIAISRLSTEINNAVADATTRGNLLRAANEPVGCTAEQLSKLFRGDYEKYGRLIRELNKHRLKSRTDCNNCGAWWLWPSLTS
jgi:hypothetical protein